MGGWMGGKANLRIAYSNQKCNCRWSLNQFKNGFKWGPRMKREPSLIGLEMVFNLFGTS